MKLEGQRVVIIGGSSGIGLATAKAAHQEGASVIIASRSAEKLSRAKTKIGERVETYTVDANNEQSLQEMFQKIGETHHLFITAQQAATGEIAETNFETLRQTLDSKIWGAFNAVKYAAPQMPRSGSITFISGLLGWRPGRGGSIAGAAGGAIEALARNLALELAPIRVNTICAGVIDTPILDGFFGTGEEREKILKDIADKLPVGRIGQSNDIADAVIFLMNNGFITGSVLHIDGGALLV